MNRILTGVMIMLLCQVAWTKDDDAYTCVPNADGSDWICSPVPKPPRMGKRSSDSTAAAPLIIPANKCRQRPEPDVMYSRSDDGMYWACRENAAGNTWDCEPIAARDMPCDSAR